MSHRGFIAHDGSHAPKWPIEIDYSNSLSRNLALCLPFYNETQLHDIGPNKYAPIGIQMSNTTRIPFGGLNKYGLNFPSTNTNDHFELDTGGRGIFATEVDSSFFVWISGVLSTNRRNNTVYVERPSATPIWKFISHGDSSMPGGIANWGMVHRDDAGTLTFAGGSDSIEGEGLSLIGFTKKGTAVTFYKNGKEVGTDTLSGTDTLATDDPNIGWDDQGSTNNLLIKGPLHWVVGWKRTLVSAECFSLFNPATRWNLYS